MKYILILTVCTSVNLIGMLESYESCHNTLAHSPNKEYHIMSSNLGTYYSDDTTKIKIFPHTQMIGKVTISDNSEHFLIELKNNLIHSCSRYKLFKINHKKLPEGVYLKNDLENTTTAIFHHDNKHIIYNKVNGIN
ncbi:MAG TPA: hypothetical protein VHX42_04670, partial [Candidatus Babeliales bacterium]|nr:hypothetical protein [Candidatus Babeliales bacterium]